MISPFWTLNDVRWGPFGVPDQGRFEEEKHRGTRTVQLGVLPSWLPTDRLRASEQLS
jgi:hypothetical protein